MPPYFCELGFPTGNCDKSKYYKKSSVKQKMKAMVPNVFPKY